MTFSHQRPGTASFSPRMLACSSVILSSVVLGFGASLFLSRKVALAAATTSHLNQPDLVCRNCHQQIYDRYEQTPMARGSGLAARGLDTEELEAKDLTHRPSGVTYHVSLRDGQAVLSYSRPATDPRGLLAGERHLEFYIGSGHRGRTYLYQQEGLWFEAPINWYSRAQQWDMAPAFDQARAMPGPLPVDPNCLHCHAGDIQQTFGFARNRFATQPFFSGGVGCSACHGDPAGHLAATGKKTPLQGLAGKADALSKTSHPSLDPIVNPSKLTPTRRDSICLQCHLEGDAVVYFPGKSLQTYSPGDELADSVAYFIDKSRANLGLRASSQYEALLRSACKRGAGDKLTCTTCHDPHSSPAPVDRVAFFRNKCLSCHTGTSMATRHHPEQQDCASCHMPTRKTADISHEQLTDHDIQARPLGADHSSPNPEAPYTVNLAAVGVAATKDRELGLAYAQLAVRGDRASGEKARTLLARAVKDGSTDTEVLDQLAYILQASGSLAAAADLYRGALRVNPIDVTAKANLAVIEASRGQSDEARLYLKAAIGEDPSQIAAELNLAFLECRVGSKAGARAVIERVLQFDPDSTQARRFLAIGAYGNQRCELQ